MPRAFELRLKTVVSATMLIMMLTALLMLLLPIWPYHNAWNYYSCLAAIVALAILIATIFRVSPQQAHRGRHYKRIIA